LDVETLVPSACHEETAAATSKHKKIVTGQTACRSSLGEAKEHFAKTE
jgi:hypothetical protein